MTTMQTALNKATNAAVQSAAVVKADMSDEAKAQRRRDKQAGEAVDPHGIDAFTHHLAGIAEFFSDLHDKADRDTGEVVTINRLRFPQLIVLRGMADQLGYLVDKANETCAKAARQVDTAARAHTGDELSELQLERKVDWLETCKLQQLAVEAAYAKAVQVFEDRTGDLYEPRGQARNVAAKPAPFDPSTLSPALQRVYALTGKVPARSTAPVRDYPV